MLYTSLICIRSEERNQALRLCGWPYDSENSILGPLLEKLQADGQVSRAAALAVFHMKIRKAIKILTRSGIQKNQVSYQLVALALAGRCLWFYKGYDKFGYYINVFKDLPTIETPYGKKCAVPKRMHWMTHIFEQPLLFWLVHQKNTMQSW